MLPQRLRRRSSPNIVEHSSLAKFSVRNMTHESPSEMLIAIEVARWLRVRPSTIYAWAAAGKIPSLKLNGIVRFCRSEIEHWIKNHSCNLADSCPSMAHSIIAPSTDTVSHDTIKEAGVRAIRQFTNRSQSQRSLRRAPLLPPHNPNE
jgi:excisionase family DNA binding protein